MKSKYMLSSIICSAILLSACNSDSSLNLLNSNDGFFGVNETQTDSKIIGDLVVLNKNEIKAAREAKIKAVNPHVKKYAKKLYEQHNANLQQTMKISRKLGVKPELNSTAVRIEKEGKEEVVHLSKLKHHEFDHAYLDDSIKDHKTALRVLDHDIAKSKSPELKLHLEKTRSAVAKHLQEAEALKK